MPVQQEINDLLQAFMYLNWLRPENAVFNVFRAYSLQDQKFVAPSIDLSCGDGLFSFITAGGRLHEGFDRFPFLNAKGYFNHIDIHDHFNRDEYKVPIERKPDLRFDLGTDIKTSMLRKAEALDFYNDLMLQDNNLPLKLPDCSFNTIYSNSIYWVNNIDLCLSEIHRILKPKGKVYLHILMKEVLNLDFIDSLNPSDEWMAIIDRGRKASYKTLKNVHWWELACKRQGFELETKRPTLSKTNAAIWNIGLRPIAPFLIRLSSLAPNDERLRIKKEFCTTMIILTQPLLVLNKTEEEAVDYLFVLTKN